MLFPQYVLVRARDMMFSSRRRLMELETRVVVVFSAQIQQWGHQRKVQISQSLARLLPEQIPIAYKLATVISLVIICGMLLLGRIVISNQSTLLQNQIDHFGSTVISQMADTIKEPLLANDRLTLNTNVADMLGHQDILGSAILSEELELIASQGFVPRPLEMKFLYDERPIDQWVETYAWLAKTENVRAQEVITFVTPVVFRELVAGYVLLTFDRSELARSKQEAIQAITAATLLMIFLGSIAALIIGKRLTRPIHALRDASREISRGNYSFRFDERRNDEIGELMLSFNTMSEGLLRKEQVENTFSRYVSPKVAKELLNDIEKVQLGGQHVQASVLFADIVGFTSLSENLSPQQVNELLNDYFTLIAEAAQSHHGHIDKFMGDCAMLVFGVPEPDEDHAKQALSCGVFIQKLVARENQRRLEQRLQTVEFRIGVNTGTMLAGNMGSRERMEYTVVGDSVNLASRLASVAGATDIIICQDLVDSPGISNNFILQHHDKLQLRGKSEPVSAYRVLDVANSMRLPMEKLLVQVHTQFVQGEV